MANSLSLYVGPDLESDSIDIDQHLNMNAISGSIQTTPARTNALESYAADVEDVFDYGLAGGNQAAGAARTSVRHVGVHSEGFGDGVLFDDIYVEIIDATSVPSTHYGTEHDVGFITEEQTLTILIWNAYLSESKSLTDVTITSGTGVTLTYPSTPEIMTPGSTIQNTLVISETGPAVQDTDFDFTVGGLVRTANLTGLRVVAVLPNPNWRSGIRFKNQYHTVMFQTPRFHEQRRVMLDLPQRSSELDYLLTGTAMHRFLYNLSYAHDKILGVPIYQEIMRPTSTGLPAGSDTITLSDSTTSKWELNNNCDYVVIIDHENAMSEIKEIDSITANTIVCTQNISATFDESTSRVYPIYFATLNSVGSSQQSDGVETIQVSFSEFKHG